MDYCERRLRELNRLSGLILGAVPNSLLIDGVDTKVWDVVSITNTPEYEPVATGLSLGQAIENAFRILNVKDQ